jgi:two-component system OmpR family sensor kinase
VTLFRTLTARLVLTSVALVAVVGILVAASATFAMRGYLTDKLDGQVHDVLRAAGRPQDGPGDGDRERFGAPGTLVAVVPASSSNAAAGGAILNRDFSTKQLSAATVTPLAKVQAGGDGHTVKVDGASYRVMTTVDPAGNVIVVGLPTSEIDSTLDSMLRWFALLTLLGVGLAGVLGTVLVRRQMRPLYAVAATAHEVSTQELAVGDTAIETRVPAELTDERTAQAIQLQIEYDPQPPFDAGSPAKAPAEVVEALVAGGAKNS